MSANYHLRRACGIWLANFVPITMMTLVYLVLSIVTLGFMSAVLEVGFMHALLRLIREERRPQVGDLFSHMHVFFPLLVFTIAVAIIAVICVVLLRVAGIILLITIAFFCIYMLTFMADQKVGVIDAIEDSVDLAVHGDIAQHIGVLVIYLLVKVLGSTIILLPVTEPIAIIFLVLVYLDRTKRRNASSQGFTLDL
ncbi:MAG: hypothetical protein QGI68_10750 [Pseudomonadales bacterium]|nr:hypothetical protein [Pseudomonadales bacterium]MDP7359600.1 hypothetical protein [Pseudomonadales bacterium]MDP7596030.1 hypothetical protein [Pseudomonadales bacterium]HJN51342.1 hypothetical protein [Pseudomonadales bacterium]